MALPEIEPRLAEGIRLFNNRRFFEAHEVLEEVWKKSDGDLRIFYQGLIQAAAALLHVERGNYPGAISVYLKARPRLDKFPPVWEQIEVGRFRAEMAHYFAALQGDRGSDKQVSLPAQALPQINRAQPPPIKSAAGS